MGQLDVVWDNMTAIWGAYLFNQIKMVYSVSVCKLTSASPSLGPSRNSKSTTGMPRWVRGMATTFVNSFIGHSGSGAAFTLQPQTGLVAAETVWPRYLLCDPLLKTFASPCAGE